MDVPAWQQIVAGVLFLLVYVVIATERIDKTKVALVGGALFLLLGIVTQHDAFGANEIRMTEIQHWAHEYHEAHAEEGTHGEAAGPAHGDEAAEAVDGAEESVLEEEPKPEAEQVEEAADTLEQAGFQDIPGADWNTIFLLIGMMVFVGITGQTGVFEWIAIKCAKVAKGEPVIILGVLAIVTAVLSAALDNVTTVLLIAPVTLVICDALAISPIPLLIGEALASNIGGTATLVGDPPNIIIGSKAGFDFMMFPQHLGPVVIVLLLLFLVYGYFMWRKLLHAEPERKAGIMELDEHKAIHNKQLLIKCLIVGALILTGFMIHGKMGWEPATVALSGAAILLLISGLHVEEAFETVEWGTIFFFLGLFIMVGGLVKVGLIEKASMIILNKFGDDTSTLAYVILWFSAIASAVVDNIPYVATMCPLMNNLAEGVTGLPALEAARTPEIMPVWWALSLGACLGGNGTLVGASANVVVVGIAKRNGHKISFMEFTKYGFPVMIWTVAVAMVYLWFRYLRHLG